MAGAGSDEPVPVVFSDDLAAVVRQVLSQAVRGTGATPDRLTKADREQLVRELDEKGIFAVQRSVPIVADELGISRATVYNHLATVRQAAAESDPKPSAPPPVVQETE